MTCRACDKVCALKIASTAIANTWLWAWRVMSVLLMCATVSLAVVLSHVEGVAWWVTFAIGVVVFIAAGSAFTSLTREDGVRLVRGAEQDKHHALVHPGSG